MTTSTKCLVFVLLSAVDFCLTYLLLNQQGELTIGEGNPAADWILDSFGWLGMAIFKALLVLVVLSLCGIVALKKPAVAARVLNLALLVVGGVVFYSCYLTAYLAATEKPASQATHFLWTPVDSPEDLENYRRQAVRDIIEENQSLMKSVLDVDLSWRESSGAPYAALEAKYPGCMPFECLATELILDVAKRTGVESGPLDPKVRRLVKEYQAYFESDPPTEVKSLLEKHDRRMEKMQWLSHPKTELY